MEGKQSAQDNRGSSVHFDDMTSEDFFLDAHARVSTQEAMLRDKDRMLILRNAISYNKHLFANKVVLDLRCGTGILSMFAAKAGAKRVFAVDSSSITDFTKKIVKDNGLEDVVTVMKGQVEEIELPSEYPKVDIIMSECMGHRLLYDGVLPIIIKARDKWLKSDGCLFPDRCCVYLTAIEDRYFKEEKVVFWNKVYGFNMSSMKEAVYGELAWQLIDPKQVVTNYYLLKRFDFYTMKEEDISFCTNFTLHAARNDYINGLITFFNVEFSKCHTYVGLTTALHSPDNHWRQTVFYIKKALVIKEKEIVTGKFCIEKTSKGLSVSIEVDFNGEFKTASFKNVYLV